MAGAPVAGSARRRTLIHHDSIGVKRRETHEIGVRIAGVSLALSGGVTATAAAYNPIVPTQSDRTITLDGKHMTIEEVVAIARYGAKVQLSPAARKRSQDAYELLLQGAKQNIPIYWFNRAPGSGRETVIFEGDPMTPENRQLLLDRQLATFKRG